MRCACWPCMVHLYIRYPILLQMVLISPAPCSVLLQSSMQKVPATQLDLGSHKQIHVLAWATARHNIGALQVGFIY